MTPISDQEREQLQAQDVALASCPYCGAAGLFSPDDTIAYVCGTHLTFGQRRGEQHVEQSTRCIERVAQGHKPHEPVTGQAQFAAASARRPTRH